MNQHEIEILISKQKELAIRYSFEINKKDNYTSNLTNQSPLKSENITAEKLIKDAEIIYQWLKKRNNQ